jgi:hypothetical protein
LSFLRLAASSPFHALLVIAICLVRRRDDKKLQGICHALQALVPRQ